LVAELIASQRELRVDLSLSDRFVDLVAEGFDLAVRIGATTGSALVARRLARTRVVACASPAYLASRGRPRVPKDLLDHDCLRYALDPSRHSWRFRSKSGDPIAVPVTGGFECNHGGALRQAALEGLGVVMFPVFYAARAIEQGDLVTVLDEFCDAEVGIHAVYPSGRLMPPKTRACVDWLARELPSRLDRARVRARQPSGAAALSPGTSHHMRGEAER
jgi:DNA-binding transcriptional LysR family regulator